MVLKLILIYLGLPLFFTASIAQNRALFFAVNDYSKNTDFANLKNPIGDAEAIAKELEEMYGFEVFVYRNPSIDKIYSALEFWQKQPFQENEQLFIFFSGHGAFWDFANKGYFIPFGHQTGYKNYIELTTLGNIVTKIQSEHILLAIDACYSGTIDQKIAFKGGSFRRSKFNDEREHHTILSQQLKNNSRLLITSGGKERTLDGDDHSPFSGAILSGLRKAYTSGGGLLLFSDIVAQLEKISPLPHTGTLIGHQGGGFVFRSTAKGIVIPDKILQKEENKNPPLTEINLPNQSLLSFSDRDGNVYTFQRMKEGKQWMAKNLNIRIGGSYCFNNEPSNCDKHGRLYTWEAAKEGCKSLGSGWRLPSKDEWSEMLRYFGGVTENPADDGKAAYRALIIGGRNDFSAQLGGYRSSRGNFNDLDRSGYYWSSTEVSSVFAWFFHFNSEYGNVHYLDYYRDYARSVRCIKD